MSPGDEGLPECIARIESALGPDVSWSFTKITNEKHGLEPAGRGVGVELVGAVGNQGIVVFEKAADFRAATERALARYIESVLANTADKAQELPPDASPAVRQAMQRFHDRLDEIKAQSVPERGGQ